MVPSGSRSARQSRGRGRGRGVSRVRAPAASSSVSTKAVSLGGVRGRRARSRAQGRSRKPMSTTITPPGMSRRCDSEPMSLDECASETGSHDDEDMELHYSDRSDSGLRSASASNEAHTVNQVTYADLIEENKENLLPNKHEYEETPVARKEGAKEDTLVHNEARVETIELKEEVKEESLVHNEVKVDTIELKKEVKDQSLDQKEESMDADDIVSVLGREVPALSGELLQRLRGLLPARAALARLARAVTRLARPTKQQQITKYFPVINRSNAAEAEHQPSASKIAPSDVQDDKPKNSNTTQVTTKTENEQTDVNKHEVEQRRPSWDVAGPSHRTHAISEEDNMDTWSLSSSPRARSPDDELEDIDTLLPPVSFSQKVPSSGRRRVKEELNRSTPSARGSGRDTKRGRGARGRASLDAREDNSELLNVFLSKMSDITSAAAELPFEMPKNAGKVQLSNPGEEEDEELGVAETYANYVPAKLSYGCPHPDPVVETSSLSSVDIADVTHQLGLPPATIEGGSLSALQLEAVVYAAQAHHHVLPDNMRAGFLIGDGAGVGKGRTIAGIIFENYLAGRKRAVWVSVSNDLKYDAERDLRDIGAAHIPVHQLSKMAYTAIAATHGVVFSTYSSLIGRTSAAGATYKRRLEQLVAWCGPHFDGCIVFDECHRAKNLCPTSGTNSSETGKAVLELQVSLPLARLVYASATGASEPRNMAYMARLGIWGAGSPFPAFRDFLKAVEKRGVGAMEIVAMDMKLRGMYIARQLSFHGVTFKIEEVPLSPQFRDTYDKAVALWVEAKKSFESCTELIDPCKRWRRVMWAQFWGAHQRFFKYLCIAAKVQRTVELTKEAVQQGKCVVIGLQATGEARTLDQLERGRGTLTEFICTAKGVFVSLVEKQFPCPNNMQEEDYENGQPSSRVEETTNAACAKLLADIEWLGRSLPPNTLDELIDRLGGPAVVAEMTGRKGRVVATDGKILYESRSEADVPLETLNLTEKQRFMDGEKDVAIISEAASSGISLQSDRRVANQKRRVHITLELPWSADRAIQQFGRTHRSNQVNAPEYIFLISDLAGERRFASTVAKRLESLGALTHGDRRATETRDLSQFNIENKHGRAAYRSMMNGIFWSASPLVPPPPCYPGDFLPDAAAALRDVGIERHEQESAGLIPRFLNRLLGVRVALQNALFQHFNDTFIATVKEAKRAGRFDLGILDVGASGQVVRRAARARYLRTHATGRAPVELHTLLVERGMEWEKAKRKFSECTRAGEGFYLARTASNNVRNAILCVAHDATRDLSHACLYNVYRPNLGMQPQPERLADITSKYVKVVPRQAEHAWRAHYQGSLTRCTHAWWHGHCKNISCEVGTRRRTYYVLSGSVLAAWRTLEATYRDLRLDSRMQVVRVHTHEGLKVIGTLVPKYMVELLSHRLKSGALSVEEEKYDV